MMIDLFMDGKNKLEELVSRRLPLEEINHAFDLLQQGEVRSLEGMTARRMRSVNGGGTGTAYGNLV